MYYDDGPDDDGSDHFIDSGWLPTDDVDELRAIIAKVDLTKPTPGDRAMAALVLLNAKLNPPAHDAPEDPHLWWARVLLQHDQ